MDYVSPIDGWPLPPPSVIMQPVVEMPLPLSYETFRSQFPAEVVEVSNEVRELSWPQYQFVMSTAKFPAMVAGFGAGKTEACVVRALRLKFDYPDQNVGYYLPTYDLIRQIVFPRIEELLISYGVGYFLNETAKELIIYGMRGKMIFRTMDAPERIIGYEHADGVIDELDTLKTNKAADVFRKVIARNRQKKPDASRNTIGVGTTPEGFKFVYEAWKRKPLKGSQLIKASTRSNAKNLPEDYVETLEDSYPGPMLKAYVEGEFVNLTTGCVYPEFDRVLNASRHRVLKPDTLHIGFDFNVGKMAAIVHVMRLGDPHAVDEFINYLDTPALIKAIKARYPENRVIAYPDASGKNRDTTNAATSDIVQLRQAGFMVLAKASNPFVRDRVAAVNKLIHKDDKRRYKVNVDACPHLVEGLEKQAYDKNGEPDKSSGFDHGNDAAGYFVSYRFPILHGKARKTNLKGT
jgi:hypothetical protein